MSNYLEMLAEAKSKADNASLKAGYSMRDVDGDDWVVIINPVRTNGKHYNRTEWRCNGERSTKEKAKNTLS